MSRFAKFAQSLASGYTLLAVNIAYTLISVRLALHYLSKTEFGLWALVTQVSSYFVLLADLGMAGAVIRILIDFKDRPAEGGYGSVIKTSALVMLVQGAVIAGLGVVSGWGLPALFDVPADYRRTFQLLVAGHCGVLGILFAGRICSHVLQAHQRFDVTNYVAIASLAVSLAVLWAGFALGWGLYSWLAAVALSQVVSNLTLWIVARRLHLFPPPGAWGRASRARFQELFRFGADLFLLSLGNQLISASQVMVISRTLGLETAAVWAIATRSFVVLQQSVFQLWTYSANAISEMIVRQERERLQQRFREIVVATAVASVLAAGLLAACNAAFLEVWTKGRIGWAALNDWLLGGLLIVSSVSRCHVGLLGQTKKIRAMRYVYFAEGVLFVVASVLVAPRWGASGILLAAIVTNLLCSGAYGVYRTAEEFHEPVGRVAVGWLRSPLTCMAIFLPVAWIEARLLGELPGLQRLMATAALVGVTGLALSWFVGFPAELRRELEAKARSLKRSLRLA